MRIVLNLPDIARADIVGHFDLLTKFDERHCLYNSGSKVCKGAPHSPQWSG